ncbi:hypothetical protein KUL17_31050 [Alteromonas sp. KUL17]|nr:hypothetical protein KUL17_31050 [Alteromonas sp. KUL17]
MAAMNHVNISTRCLAIGEGPYMVLSVYKYVAHGPSRIFLPKVNQIFAFTVKVGWSN